MKYIIVIINEGYGPIVYAFNDLEEATLCYNTFYGDMIYLYEYRKHEMGHLFLIDYQKGFKYR